MANLKEVQQHSKYEIRGKQITTHLEKPPLSGGLEGTKIKTMKKYISILTIVLSGIAYSQVIIGNSTGTASVKTSVLLEFAAGQNKGVILPYNRTLPTGDSLVPGVMILDATDITKAKVKFYAPGNARAVGNWVDLSTGNEADITTHMAKQPAGGVENSDSKVIIGAASSNADGVLVLESTTKAMVLPIVADTNNVINPAPGMMVYINKTGAKRLAVFNGAVWTYWKP